MESLFSCGYVQKARWFITALFIVLCMPAYAENASDLKSKSQTVKENNSRPNKDHQFTLRYGQGGFRDNRSPEGSLGGGQFALDVTINDSPFSILLTSEYYTNSPEPTHNYEIRKLYAVNLLYHYQLSSMKHTSLFAGGGLGKLNVPESESNPGKSISSELINLEMGIDYQPYEHFGFYGLIKYLKAKKEVANISVIEFDEVIFLIGVSYGFDL